MTIDTSQASLEWCLQNLAAMRSETPPRPPADINQAVQAVLDAAQRPVTEAMAKLARLSAEEATIRDQLAMGQGDPSELGRIGDEIAAAQLQLAQARTTLESVTRELRKQANDDLLDDALVTFGTADRQHRRQVEAFRKSAAELLESIRTYEATRRQVLVPIIASVPSGGRFVNGPAGVTIDTHRITSLTKPTAVEVIRAVADVIGLADDFAELGEQLRQTGRVQPGLRSIPEEPEEKETA